MDKAAGSPSGRAVFAGRSPAARFLIPAGIATTALVGYLWVLAGAVPAVLTAVAVATVAALACVDGQMREWWRVHGLVEEVRGQMRTVTLAAAEAEAHIDDLRRENAVLRGVDPDLEAGQLAE